MDCPSCGEFNSSLAIACCECGHPFKTAKAATKKHAHKSRSGSSQDTADGETSTNSVETANGSPMTLADMTAQARDSLNRGMTPEKACSVLMTAGIEEEVAVRVVDGEYVSRYREAQKRSALGWILVGAAITIGTLLLAPGGLLIIAWGPVLYGLARFANPGTPRRWRTPEFERAREEASRINAQRGFGNPLHVDIGAVDVAVRTEGVLSNAQLVARCAEAGTLDLAIVRGHFPSLTHGSEKVRTGDEAFDEGFSITTNDPDVARAWLGPDVRRALLDASISDCRVANRLVRARSSPAGSPEIDKRALATLASGSAFIAAQWTRLAAELGGELLGEAERHDELPPIRIVKAGVDYSIEIARRRGGTIRQRPPTFTRIDVPLRPRALGRVAIMAKASTEPVLSLLDIDPPVRSLGDDLCAAGDGDAAFPDRTLAAVSNASVAAVLFANDTLSVFLRGFVVTPTDMENGMALARALTTTLPHPYR